MTTRNNGAPWKHYLSLRFLVSKVREKGIVWCLKEAIARFSWRVRGSADRLADNRFGWAFPYRYLLLRRPVQSEKRLLAICDFRTIPYTIGELLWFQALTMMLRIEHEADKIDIVWLCDPKEPARSDQGITLSNYHYHLSTLLPIAHVNPYLGAFFLMDSVEAVRLYVRENAHRYCYIEPRFQDFAEKRLVYKQWYRRLLNFHAQNGFIPYLSCKPGVLLWARSFIAEEVRPRFPVVVLMRNNPAWGIERNAQLDSWLEFLSFCNGRYDVKFIGIGTREEIDPRFRALDNVIFSKDYGTTIEQDLALIQTSLMYLGSTSGPGVMASLSNRPYFIFNFRPSHTRLPSGAQYPFATPLQKLVWEPETAELLIHEFSDVFSQIDSSRWAQEFDRLALEGTGLLRRDTGQSQSSIQIKSSSCEPVINSLIGKTHQRDRATD